MAKNGEMASILEVEAQFVAFGLDGANNVDVTVHLNIVWHCVPFSLNRFLWSHFDEIGNYVLTLRHLNDGLVVHDDFDSCFVDMDCSAHLGRFNTAFQCDAVDEIFQSPLHQVHRAVIVVLGLLAGDSRPNVQASHCERVSWI